MLKLKTATIIAVCSVAWTFAQQPKPLSKESISKLLSAQVYPHRIETLAQELHVDFQMTPELEKQFRALGASDELLEVLRKSYQPPSVAPPAPKPETPAELAMQHYRQGEAYYAGSKWDDAIKEYQEAAKLKPDDAAAYGAWGFALVAKGNIDGAIAEYREAMRLKPADADLHNDLGEALYKKGNLDGAIAEYGKALQLTPNDSHLHNNLGAALDAEGKVDQAIQEYREAVRLAPDDALAHNNLGVALGKKGDEQGATAEYEKAVKLDPNYAEAWYDLAMGLGATKQVDGSAAAIRRALHLKPDWPEAHLYLGRLLEQNDQFRSALAEYLEAARLKASDPIPHSREAAVLSLLGCWRESAEALGQVVSLSPGDASAHASLGDALYRVRDLKSSLEQYETATRLAPNNKEFKEAFRKVSKELKKYRKRDADSQASEPSSCRDTKDLTALLPSLEGLAESPPAPARHDASAADASNRITRIHVGGGVAAAKIIYAPAPQYPPLAKMDHLQGVVRLEALIGKDGSIQDLKVISGHPLLVKAAMDAVTRWRYQPTLLNGEAVEVATEIDVNFSLHR